jgi:hypothetical protein
MLQNTVSEVANLSIVSQLSDQVVARGRSYLGFKDYLELLLSACSPYEKTHTTPCPGKRNVYSANFTQDDDFYYTHHGHTYGVDTDVTDILSHTATMQFKAKSSGNCNDKKLFIPREEWLKPSPENREEIITTRRNERSTCFSENPPPYTPVQHVNVHDTQEVVNVDNIIEYTANAHLSTETSGNGEESSYSLDASLAHISGITLAGGSPRAETCHVLAAKQGNSGRKGMSFKANQTSTTWNTLTISDTARTF